MRVGQTGGAQHDYGDAVAPALLAQFSDLDRLCPMLAGVGWCRGDRLSLRLPTGDLQVQAPGRLLQAVWAGCDGTRSFNEIVAAVPARSRDELRRFMLHLLDVGALIDAIFATRSASCYAHQTVPLGRSAPDALTAGIGGRFLARNGGTPDASEPAIRIAAGAMDALFEARQSTYGFGDAPVTVDRLGALLWSLGGVVQASHPRKAETIAHRTLGSAGAMYLVRWLLVLRQPVEGYGPGVYEVSFPRPREVRLVLRSAGASWLPRAFTRPWQLGSATGAVFGVADARLAALRYRNRAVQYLFMDAGAALQNLSLASRPLGLASAVIGGYSEEFAAHRLGLQDELLVGSAIFGAAPPAQPATAPARTLPIDFVWADSPSAVYRLPFFIARARPKDRVGNEYNCWGKDVDPRMAYIKAHAEAVERQGMREPRHIVVGHTDEVPLPILPAEIARYSDAQHARPGFPYQRFDPQRVHAWVPGIRHDDDAVVSVPAQLVYGRAALEAFVPGAPLCLQFNSSGCAAGASLDAAFQAALLEVIERDAFMRHWLAQVPGELIPDRQLPAAVLARLRELRSRGCRVVLQLLHGAAAQVVLASATHDGRHFTCVAAAARFIRADACAAALDELEVMVFTRLVGMEQPEVRPNEVEDPAGHAWLYTRPAYYRKADRVLRPRRQAPAQPEGEGLEGLDDLCAVLAMQGLRPVRVDITPQRHCIDQGRIPLTVVKAVVPGLIPISFGAGREPRGMLAGVHPASFFPHPFP